MNILIVGDKFRVRRFESQYMARNQLRCEALKIFFLLFHEFLNGDLVCWRV